jgi:GNAT superfamily N-acetyltransferase
MWAAWEKSGDARHITGAVEENFAEGAYPDKKYTIKKSYTMSKDGVEKSVWYIMDGDFVVDATDLRRDAKYYADKWNAAEKESSNASQNLHKQGVAEGMEHYDGIEISMEKEDDEIMVKAMMPGGRELGHVLFVQEGDYLMPQDLEVDERYQGQGIAATMYDYVKSKGYKIRRSGQQTDAGAGFWDKHRPEQNVWENFADGKNPGRKGLAKRSGVNTKASVSSLRKTAKNSSGEKQRMAHWLANMKAGRAKAKRK